MPTLMIQGTTSDAGKSTLVAAICRAFKRRGIAVAPFKPQNMALNSAVTADGGEIGRAQALQAQACGLEPSVDMNPVLLKPCTDIGAQVIVQGKAIGNMSATTYHDYKQVAKEAVLDSHARLEAQYDIVLVEGAGSPAEINLRANDIANMGFAEAVDCPVLLVADIDRGGVFAHLVGTLNLLSESEQARLKGFVINRFRGDIALLQSGLDWLEQHTSRKVYGVLPYLHNLQLEAEDAVAKSNVLADGAQAGEQRIKVVVPVLPRISNHTDFDVLRWHPQVDFEFVATGAAIPPADLVILPGSKSVRTDLARLRETGWAAYLQKHLRYGGKVLGVCGGYQMLGAQVHDPDGIEGEPGSTEGFGLLNIETTLKPEKILANKTGRLHLSADHAKAQVEISGYEIHAGISKGEGLVRPFLSVDSDEANTSDGCISEDEQVAGTYWHGLFDSPEAQTAILSWAGLGVETALDLAELREQELDRLADSLEQAFDMDAFIAEYVDGPKLQPQKHGGKSA